MKESKNEKYKSPSKDAVFFRIGIGNYRGVVNRVLQRFSKHSQELLAAVATDSIAGSTGVFEVFAEDVTVTKGYLPLLRLCRDLQALEWCNHLYARFIKYIAIANLYAPGIESIMHSNKGTPFESFYSGQQINTQDALHPDNVSDSVLNTTFSALDEAMSEFIKEPERLFNVSPKYLEEIVGKIYSSHGFDVKVLGGPKDHGIDLSGVVHIPMSLPKKLSQHMSIGIQVKRYKKNRKVREKEVRDLYGSIIAEGYDKGVLVTTSSLTASAQSYLEARRTVEDRITIISGEEVLELLISYCKQRLAPFWK